MQRSCSVFICSALFMSQSKVKSYLTNTSQIIVVTGLFFFFFWPIIVEEIAAPPILLALLRPVFVVFMYFF